MSNKVAVVTGGTSGIGRATALALKDAGCTVYELSRRAQGVEGLHHISADVTKEESGGKAGVTSAATGDGFPMGGMAAALLVSGSALVMLTTRARRKEEE